MLPCLKSIRKSRLHSGQLIWFQVNHVTTRLKFTVFGFTFPSKMLLTAEEYEATLHYLVFHLSGSKIPLTSWKMSLARFIAMAEKQNPRASLHYYKKLLHEEFRAEGLWSCVEDVNTAVEEYFISLPVAVNFIERGKGDNANRFFHQFLQLKRQALANLQKPTFYTVLTAADAVVAEVVPPSVHQTILAPSTPLTLASMVALAPKDYGQEIAILTDADFDNESRAIVPAEIIRATTRVEKTVADRHAIRLHGAREVRVESGICDIVTTEAAIEVKNILRWKHAQGQAQNYAMDLNKKPAVHLFYTQDTTLQRLRSLIVSRCDAFAIAVSFEFVDQNLA
jgi:hypothetical protein